MAKTRTEISLDFLLGNKRRAPTPTTDAKVALITGITGQDGLYMAAHLLAKQTRNAPYHVHGICRKNSLNLPLVQELSQRTRQNSSLTLYYGDVTDTFFMMELIKRLEPDEVYNFAALS